MRRKSGPKNVYGTPVPIPWLVRRICPWIYSVGQSVRSAPGEEIFNTRNSTTIAGREGATNAHRVAQTLALIVVHLCQHRIDSAHVSDVNASNLTAAELGELLDVSS